MLLRQQYLGAPVPKSHYLVRVGLDWHAKGTSQTEISQLNYVAIGADEQVLRFEVPVEDPI